MTADESITMVQAASLEVYPSVAEVMRLAGARDNRLGADIVTRTARLAVAAWVMAVDGDEATITAIARPEAAYFLMHPGQESWQVTPGPKVTRISVTGLDTDASPPELRVKFEFTGRRRFEDPRKAGADGEMQFTGILSLTLHDAGSWPWQLTSGHVATLDEFLGYVFTSRRESPEEHRRRTSSSTGPAAAEPPATFRLVAGFAEHDERLGSSASVDVHLETAPTREEAEKLVWPAIWAECLRALGPGEWRPTMLWLDLIELLG